MHPLLFQQVLIHSCSYSQQHLLLVNQMTAFAQVNWGF